MQIEDRKALRAAAAESLQAQQTRSRQIVRIYAGVTAALKLVCIGLILLLDQQAGRTTGLSGMARQTTLQSLEYVLSFLPGIFTLFWDMGYLYAMLRIGRGEPAAQENLTEGFRRFWPVLRLNLLRSLLYTAVCLVCLYGLAILLSFTPLAWPLYSLLPSNPSDASEVLSPAVLQALLPMECILGVGVVTVFALVAYPLRMSNYLLLDHTREGARAAMRGSRALMQGNKAALLKLDLSFWWYYVLQVLAAGLMNLPDLLSFGGVTLPLSDTAATVVCGAAGLLCSCGLTLLAGNRVAGTYVQFYRELEQAAPVRQAKPEPEQKNQPWNY